MFVIFDRSPDDTLALRQRLYRYRIHSLHLSPNEMDRIVDVVCTLCREHEKAGFVEGVKVGILLSKEMRYC